MPLPLRPALPALALLALACAAPVSAEQPAKKTPPPAAAATPAADAPIYDPDLIGDKAIAVAQKVASDSGRRLLVNLGTNDCRPCAVVNRALHKNNFFEVFSQQFVAEYVDVSNMPNAALIDRYHINPKAELPAIIILMPDGRLIEALAHGEMAAIAKKGEPAVQEWLLKRFAKQ
ncbi:MAG: thioredoxin family protein [Acidobacteria bacterium]|nr:thioredoxin family protein [Acidobacteriota bacterium]